MINTKNKSVKYLLIYFCILIINIIVSFLILFIYLPKISSAEETYVGAIDEGTSSTRFMVCILSTLFLFFLPNITYFNFNCPIKVFKNA